MMLVEIFFSPYFQTAVALCNIFIAWSFYDQRIRKIPLNKLDYYTRLHVDRLESSRKKEIARRGAIGRKEILELNRVISVDVTEHKEGKFLIVGGTRKQHPGPFNPNAFFLNDQGVSIKLINDVLDRKYINRPPHFIDDGLLPPIDFDFHEAIFSVFLAHLSFAKLTLVERFFHPLESKERILYLMKIANSVVEMAMKNQESLAAFHRTVNGWTGTGDVPGFLFAIKQAVEYRSKPENHG